MKYTQGPWKFTLGNDKNAHNGEIRAKNGELLNLRATMNERDIATMRLMAAAPDLLEVCQYAIKHLRSVKGKAFPIMPILNAINKATKEDY